MHIRNATPADREAIIAIDDLATPGSGRVDFINRAVESPDCLVAERDAHLVAYGVLEYTFYGCRFISTALTPDQLARLFNIYSDEYGSGSAAYARKTFPEWQSEFKRPSAQTINRLLDSLPKVLNFDVKCELLRS